MPGLRFRWERTTHRQRPLEGAINESDCSRMLELDLGASQDVSGCLEQIDAGVERMFHEFKSNFDCEAILAVHLPIEAALADGGAAPASESSCTPSDAGAAASGAPRRSCDLMENRLGEEELARVENGLVDAVAGAKSDRFRVVRMPALEGGDAASDPRLANALRTATSTDAGSRVTLARLLCARHTAIPSALKLLSRRGDGAPSVSIFYLMVKARASAARDVAIVPASVIAELCACAGVPPPAAAAANRAGDGGAGAQARARDHPGAAAAERPAAKVAAAGHVVAAAAATTVASGAATGRPAMRVATAAAAPPAVVDRVPALAQGGGLRYGLAPPRTPSAAAAPPAVVDRVPALAQGGGLWYGLAPPRTPSPARAPPAPGLVTPEAVSRAARAPAPAHCTQRRVKLFHLPEPGRKAHLFESCHYLLRAANIDRRKQELRAAPGDAVGRALCRPCLAKAGFDRTATFDAVAERILARTSGPVVGC